MARLIDADALKKEWSMGDKCEDCPQDARRCQFEQDFTRMDICEMIDEAPTIGGWISVKKDGNPDCRGIYLTILEGGEYRILAYQDYGDGLFWYDDDPEQDYVRVDIVTHWMSLPEPPEEVKWA